MSSLISKLHPKISLNLGLRARAALTELCKLYSVSYLRPNSNQSGLFIFDCYTCYLVNYNPQNSLCQGCVIHSAELHLELSYSVRRFGTYGSRSSTVIYVHCIRALKLSARKNLHLVRIVFFLTAMLTRFLWIRIFGFLQKAEKQFQ